jgi:hypothetical protein
MFLKHLVIFIHVQGKIRDSMFYLYVLKRLTNGVWRKQTHKPTLVSCCIGSLGSLLCENNILLFIFVFWDVLPCKIIVDRRFRGTCCLYHQGWLIPDDGGSTTQKTFLNFMLTAVRTWNLTFYCFGHLLHRTSQLMTFSRSRNKVLLKG